MSLPAALGVVGAGTMGAGIAQLGCAAGIRTLLHDPMPDALERGVASAHKGLAKWAERGRADAGAAELLQPADSLEGLAEAELVIEAAPERTDLKRELFERLSEVCGEDAILATNTSSIPVTSLAGAAAHPGNVVGMHFFNPPPLMKLLEVIAADQTGERALALARATGEAMGKQVIVAADGPGFLVNRCGRPFYTEALRLLQERVATAEQIDRICRLGGGFRMGPFELMDLVGIDTGLAVARSFDELSFGEPRWRPNPIQARMVAAGRLGRKTGRGYYDYAQDPYRPEDPGDLAEVPHDLDIAGALFVPGSRLVELTGERNVQLERRVESLGLAWEWVGTAPGGVLRRILAQLVNEAAFAIGEGVGSAEDVDTGLKLGLNHPRGPMEWGELLGFGSVLRTIDELHDWYHEDRYRAAPLLRAGLASRGAG